MSSHQELKRQLRRIGHNNWLLARAEIQHLPEILLDDEVVYRIVTGGRPDGIAVLVATNRRLLLVDKSPFTLDVEDFPYAHIANAEHKFGFIFGTIKISTLNRELVFTRVNPRKVGGFAKFVHFKIREAADALRKVTQEIDPQSMRSNRFPNLNINSMPQQDSQAPNPFAPRSTYDY